jgi:carbamate kinase
LDADRAPQLKTVVGLLTLISVEQNHAKYEKPERTVGVVFHGDYPNKQLQREHT